MYSVVDSVIKIGYQGAEGSNSEEAAIIIAERLNIAKYELVPLITSRVVVGKLKRKEIDYAVMATKNSLGGTVQETYDIIKDEFLELVATSILRIHHCLFVKPGTRREEISCIASHSQVFKQTINTRSRHYPNASEKRMDDSAIAAKELSEGKLPDTTAVLCRKNAGELYKLELVHENLEDGGESFTEFGMFKLPEIDYSHSVKPSVREKLIFPFINEKGVGIISKVAIIASIFLSIYISNSFKWSAFSTATFVGGYASFLILFITSKNWGKKTRYNSFVGYWKYYSFSEKKDGVDVRQQIDVPRVVKIDIVDKELHFSGFICDNKNLLLFETQQVFVSSIGKGKGQLTYWYANPKKRDMGIVLDGIVDLRWVSKYPETKINLMSGRYYGMLTGDYGQIRYQRISKKEYEVFLNSDFL